MAASEKTGRDVHRFQIVSFDPSQVVTVFFFVYSQINIHPVSFLNITLVAISFHLY